MKLATVGIVGAGQLGRMLALAGHRLAVDCVLLDRDSDSPGAQVAALRRAPLDDADAIGALAREVEVVTFEIENIPAAALRAAAQHTPVYPPPAAIEAAQDRLVERQLLQALGIPTAAFIPIDQRADLDRAARELGLPLVVKARRMGYDGRGQRVIQHTDQLAAAWADLGEPPAIAEAWVEFERELSLVAVRGAGDERVYYPLTENVHRDGILHTSVAPYDDRALQSLAESWLDALFDALDYRGVLTVELFHVNGSLLVNEMAPRVHNSGHWTIEGALTSQFENHLRAVLGWPLGAPSARGHAAMVNLLGTLPPIERLLAVPGAQVHVYGKSARPGRKIGHCTLVDADRARLLQRLDVLTSMIPVA